MRYACIGVPAFLLLSALLLAEAASVGGSATPKIERVKSLDEDPLSSAPGVFFHEDLETITELKESFHDQGLDGGRFRISDVDPFSGKRSIQQTYRPLTEFPEGADKGSAGWVWRYFGDNPRSSQTRGGPQVRTVVTRWYHKFEEGFTPREGSHFPPKMGRMRCFGEGEWHGLYTILFWIGGADAHISIERHTRAPQAHREWPPNHYCQWFFSRPENVGRWIHFELRVALGEGTRSDSIQAWADGALVCDITGDDCAAGFKELGLNGMSWDCYWNGGSPRKQSRFYDDLMLSTRPIGPARTGPNPVIVKSVTPDVQNWEVEVAQAAQKPLVTAKTVDGVVTQHEPAEFECTVVWRASVKGETSEAGVTAESGQFVGPLAGKNGLESNTLHLVRVRSETAEGSWSDWSPWHAAFATAWDEGTPKDQRTPPVGYSLGHAAE